MVKMQQLKKTYSFSNWEQLENERINVYADSAPPVKLLKCLVDNGLDLVNEEVAKLLRLILTLSVTTASSERSMSTLKRIKTYLRNTMSNDRLPNLGMLAVEKHLLANLSSEQNFIERVIDVFANKKTRKVNFLYKKTLKKNSN
ncbi:hypothetical protein ILUMI_15012 [Ignelater luminosus]|uniref:HAT C-terminal dimerisation domain-containing protein n=1 Tax=Ignelater luminosus TaxID=2038154 RepID=A0A8K0CTV7_IGNLU|nr:hypothetical protein ILUMI_15012 [Ignelater luminosus]